MKDIVSIRKMRPCEPVPDPRDPDGLTAGVLPVEGADGVVSDDFFRGGNSLSVAAQLPSEVELKICFHDLGCLRFVEEENVVFDAVAHRWWQAGVDFLIVGGIGVEESLTRPPLQKVQVLLIVQQMKLHVSLRITRRFTPGLNERLKRPMQLRG